MVTPLERQPVEMDEYCSSCHVSGTLGGKSPICNINEEDGSCLYIPKKI